MYHERVWPPLGWFLISLLIIPAVILALSPINVVLGVIMSVVLYAAIVAFLLSVSSRLEVTEQEFRAGRGRIEREFLGEATVVPATEVFAALHYELDARAWLCLRSWVGGLVRVPLNDPNDPTPYWLVSTRQPERLVAALRGE